MSETEKQRMDAYEKCISGETEAADLAERLYKLRGEMLAAGKAIIRKSPLPDTPVFDALCKRATIKQRAQYKKILIRHIAIIELADLPIRAQLLNALFQWIVEKIELANPKGETISKEEWDKVVDCEKRILPMIEDMGWTAFIAKGVADKANADRAAFDSAWGVIKAIAHRISANDKEQLRSAQLRRAATYYHANRAVGNRVGITDAANAFISDRQEEKTKGGYETSTAVRNALYKHAKELGLASAIGKDGRGRKKRRDGARSKPLAKPNK